MARSSVAKVKKTAAVDQDQQTRMRMWLRLLTSTNVGLNWLRRSLRDEFGVTLPVFEMLMQIQRPPLGPTMGELSARLMVTKGHVSELVERLEAKGLVERHSNPNDGRLQLVYLTQEGKTLFDRVLPVHHARIDELLAGMDLASVEQLYELLGEFRASALAAENREAGAAPAIGVGQSDRRRARTKRN